MGRSLLLVRLLRDKADQLKQEEKQIADMIEELKKLQEKAEED